MDVLENEQDRDPQRSPWLARVVGGVAAVAVGVAVLPTLLGDIAGPSDVAAAPSATPLDAADSPSAPASSSSPPLLRQPTVTNAHVALSTDSLSILDVDGADTHTLFLPESYGGARPGSVQRIGDATVMLAEPQQTGAGPNSHAFVVHDNGVTVPLGIAARMLPASNDAVWLTRRDADRESVRLVGLDGVERLAARPLPSELRVMAAGTLLLLGAPVGGRAGQIVEWDPVTGDTKAVLATWGLVHDANAQRMLWQECNRCEVQSYDRDTGVSHPLARLPDDYRLTGRASLSPDGRHWSGVVSTAAEPTRRSIVIGHLPGSQYADSMSFHLDVPAVGRVSGPRMSWSESGWLFVSTGYSLAAVSPGPHQAFSLQVPDHDSIAAW
jgi:hypothetical protein